MNTKLIMTASAITLGAGGIFLTFMPDVALDYLNAENTKPLQFIIQILGALYAAFAMQNWMLKSSLIGGIYNRPLAMANFTHFSIAGLALFKGIIANPDLTIIIWIVGGLYSVFGVSYGIILFRHPIKEKI